MTPRTVLSASAIGLATKVELESKTLTISLESLHRMQHAGLLAGD